MHDAVVDLGGCGTSDHVLLSHVIIGITWYPASWYLVVPCTADTDNLVLRGVCSSWLRESCSIFCLQYYHCATSSNKPYTKTNDHGKIVC